MDVKLGHSHDREVVGKGAVFGFDAGERSERAAGSWRQGEGLGRLFSFGVGYAETRGSLGT